MNLGANGAQNQISRVSAEQKERERVAVNELAPFLRDPPQNQKYSSNAASNGSSRGVAIVYASHLAVTDVRSTCEAFGALEAFRSDFAESKGVYFVTFYDLRSARLAVAELPKALNQSGNEQVEAKYCVPINSSNATDESMILLSNVPGTIDEQDVSQAMSSFGEIRNVHYQASINDDETDRVTYLVEFYDIQDSRQALMELEHSTPWGTDIVVKVGSRNPTKRKQGKELLVLMSSWRQGQKAESASNFVSPSPSPKPTGDLSSQTTDVRVQSDSATNIHYGNAHAQSNYQYNVQNQEFQQQFATQLVVGPDGNYMYILVPQQAPATQAYGFPGQMVIDPHSHQHQQYMYGNQQFHQQLQIDQQYMQYNNGVQASNYSIHPQDNPPTQFVRLPTDLNTWNSGSLSSGSGQSPMYPHVQRTNLQKDMKSTTSHGSGSSSGNHAREDENTSLSLDIESVRKGTDVRSSLMVRNIPNKYTQRMLLSEFAESGHGSDKMDFFYLPIDFKNKCNRGYAFVNFVDFKDIIPFFDAYNGKSWTKFNSDKICDITYARIQGKAAMLKRFENSALMEKDDEYRPMVFVSHGERKGQLEAMSAANMNMR
jgi:RNA recognition motif-containing protein